MPPAPAPPGGSSASATVARRRSLRLSAKTGGQLAEPESQPEPEASSPPAPPVPELREAHPPAELAPSDTVVNDDEHEGDFTADFTDDEVDVDAEVCLCLSLPLFLC